MKVVSIDCLISKITTQNIGQIQVPQFQVPQIQDFIILSDYINPRPPNSLKHVHHIRDAEIVAQPIMQASCRNDSQVNLTGDHDWITLSQMRTTLTEEWSRKQPSQSHLLHHVH